MKTYEKFLKQVKSSGSMKGFSETQLRGQYEGQCELLRLFKIVIEFCDKNNLNYFATGGTLLGSVRENGFISHDADIDIALVDEEYDYFYRNFPKNTKSFHLSNDTTDPVNLKTLYGPGHIYYVGDISSDGESYVGNINRVVSKKWIYNPWIQNDRRTGSRPYHCGVRVDVFKLSSCTETEVLIPAWKGNEWLTWRNNSFHLKKEEVLPLKRSKFEDIEINIPNREDIWLKASWGDDYMKPLRNGYPHEYPKHGKISKLDPNNLPPMYEKHYKHLYE